MPLTTQISAGFQRVGAEFKSVRTALAGKEPTITPGTASQYWRGDKVWTSLTRNDVGLSNVDNISDANKPVSTAQAAALATKADAAFPVNASSGQRLIEANAPEDSRFVGMVGAMNDIAFNTARGGSVTYTLNGSASSPSVPDNPFRPDATFTTWNSLASTDTLVIEVALCRNFNYTQFHGIQFPSSGWIARNIMIERYVVEDAAWVTELNVTGQTNITTYCSGPPGGAKNVSRLRFTLTNFASSTCRIASIFAIGYNSDLLTAGFMDRSGGNVYGQINSTVDPTASTHLARKGYVDAQIATRAPTVHTHAISDVTNLQSSLDAKEPVITAGTTAQYWRGDKTWQALNKAAVGLANVDNTSDANKPVSTATQTALNTKEPTITAGTTAQYWRGDKTWVSLDKTAVGLANVDNTSDVNKPVSTAQQAALDAKQSLSARNAVNGYAGLDANGLIPSSILPSYVDDVVEYNGTANFPATGETGKIYTDTSTNRVYRWSGSTYVEISAAPGSTDAVPEGTTNLYYTQARADARAAAALAARQVIAGTGLSGGGALSADRTLSVVYGTAANTAAQGNDTRLSDTRTPTDGTVSTAKIVDLAVSTVKIADLAVTTAKINDLGVTSGKLADGAVLTAKITDGNVTKAKLETSVQTSLGKADTALQSAPVTSVAGKTGAVTLVKADVGLGNVDNTADSAKPVSTAQAASIATRAAALQVVSTQTANFAPTAGNAYPVDATAGAVTATLPTSTANQWLSVKKIDASANQVILAGTINGTANTTLPLSTRDQGKLLVADGNGGWFAIVGDLTLPSLDARYEPLVAAGTASQYRRGDKTWATLNTDAVPEATNLYYTQARADARVRAVGDQAYAPGAELWRFDVGTGTRKLSNKLRQALAGTGTLDALVIGDSVSAMYDGTAFNFTQQWWKQLKGSMLAEGYCCGGTGFVPTLHGTTGGSSPLYGVDPRYTVGGNWNYTNVSYLQAGANGATLTFTADVVGTSVQVLYSQAGGSFTVSIDGAAAETVTTSGASAAAYYTKTGLSNTLHTVTMTCNANAIIFGVSINTGQGIRISQLGKYGGTAFGFNQDYNLVKSITQAAVPNPDVLLLAIGANDIISDGRSASALMTELTTIRNLYPNADCVLFIEPLTTTAVTEATWLTFEQAMRQLSVTLGAPLVDWHMRYGGAASMQAMGYVGADNKHPNVAGETDMAAVARRGLEQVYRATNPVAGKLPFFAEIILNSQPLVSGYNDVEGGVLIPPGYNNGILLDAVAIRIGDAASTVGTGDLQVQIQLGNATTNQTTLLTTVTLAAGANNVVATLGTPVVCQANTVLRANVVLGSAVVNKSLYLQYRGRFGGN